MICRTEISQVWVQEYNVENRISAVYKMDGTDCASQGSATDTWTYTYDGDGVRVKEVYMVGAVVTMTKYYFAGGAYEIQDDGSTQTTLRYYSIAGQMVAMHDGTDLVYFASDHLSSASLVMNDTGGLLSQNRYLPFGEVRDDIASSPITQTDFGYTGQRNLASIGLMDYDARFYSPTLGRFLQPDTVVPEPGNPQALNRYSYTFNNPVIHIDPSGHFVLATIASAIAIGFTIGAVVNLGSQVYTQVVNEGKSFDQVNIDVKEAVASGVGGAVFGGLMAVAAPVAVTLLQTVGAGAAAGVVSGQVQALTEAGLNRKSISEAREYGFGDLKYMGNTALSGGIAGGMGWTVNRLRYQNYVNDTMKIKTPKIKTSLYQTEYQKFYGQNTSKYFVDYGTLGPPGSFSTFVTRSSAFSLSDVAIEIVQNKILDTLNNETTSNNSRRQNSIQKDLRFDSNQPIAY
jgi:RHS repeat-associated protein